VLVSAKILACVLKSRRSYRNNENGGYLELKLTTTGLKNKITLKKIYTSLVQVGANIYALLLKNRISYQQYTVNGG
jgi:ABC-type transport system involved in cytochrome c biogenesis permease component